MLGSPAPGAPGSPGSPAGAQILVVEDERALRETLAYNLRRAGFEVRLAEDGAGALAAARARPPDLILLDVLLPGGADGFEVCRRLRHDLRCPIVLVSALADEVDRVVGLEVGADDYVTKPFSVVELLARIRAHLRRAGMPARPAGGSAARAPAPPGARKGAAPGPPRRPRWWWATWRSTPGGGRCAWPGSRSPSSGASSTSCTTWPATPG